MCDRTRIAQHHARAEFASVAHPYACRFRAVEQDTCNLGAGDHHAALALDLWDDGRRDRTRSSHRVAGPAKIMLSDSGVNGKAAFPGGNP